MKNQKRQLPVLQGMTALAFVAVAVNAAMADAEFEQMRQRALGRERLVIYNNDGDDMQR